jgi:hypothetical protein
VAASAKPERGLLMHGTKARRFSVPFHSLPPLSRLCLLLEVLDLTCVPPSTRRNPVERQQARGQCHMDRSTEILINWSAFLSVPRLLAMVNDQRIGLEPLPNGKWSFPASLRASKYLVCNRLMGECS